MAGDLAALTTIWSTFPSTMTTADKMSALNHVTAIGPARDVLRSEIKKVLSVNGTMTKMQAYVANPTAATQPCLTATNYIVALITYEAALASVGDTLKTSDPTNLNTIQSMVPNLLSDPNNGLTQDVMDQVMALITPRVPWWQANGFSGPILVSDLIAAGDLF